MKNKSFQNGRMSKLKLFRNSHTVFSKLIHSIIPFRVRTLYCTVLLLAFHVCILRIFARSRQVDMKDK